MSCEHKIVDRVASDATVLRDLDSELASFISFDISTQPPRRRRSWSSSMLADGAVETANAYENREITISMRPKPGSTSQQQASDLGTLQRLFASGGKWLKHRPEGVTSPVFYRLLPAEIDFTEYYLTSHPDRDVIFTIPADPFGYGLPETGTATVTNDPTDSNGMRFSIANVKGDVPAPLKLEVDGTPTNSVLVATSSSSAFPHAVTTVPFIDPSTGWTASTESDASAVGGSFRRITGSGGARSTFTFDVTSLANITPGDYRVIVRAKASTSGVALGLRSQLLNPIGTEVELPTSGWRWIDLGVMRLPNASRRATPFSPVSPATTSVYVAANVESPSGSVEIDLDHVVAVPAPGPDGSRGELLLGKWRDAPLPDEVETAVIDSAGDSMWSKLSDDIEPPWTVEGGFPHVSPGASSLVIYMGFLYASAALSYAADVDWSYHPRYLYQRGD